MMMRGALENAHSYVHDFSSEPRRPDVSGIYGFAAQGAIPDPTLLLDRMLEDIQSPGPAIKQQWMVKEGHGWPGSSSSRQNWRAKTFPALHFGPIFAGRQLKLYWISIFQEKANGSILWPL